jgi:hypothetical protein
MMALLMDVLWPDPTPIHPGLSRSNSRGAPALASIGFVAILMFPREALNEQKKRPPKEAQNFTQHWNEERLSCKASQLDRHYGMLRAINEKHESSIARPGYRP